MTKKPTEADLAHVAMIFMKTHDIGVHPYLVKGSKRWMAFTIDGGSLASGPGPIEALAEFIRKFQDQQKPKRGRPPKAKAPTDP